MIIKVAEDMVIKEVVVNIKEAEVFRTLLAGIIKAVGDIMEVMEEEGLKMIVEVQVSKVRYVITILKQWYHSKLGVA